MKSNEEIINTFYTAFSQRDYKVMSSCYHPEIEFEDPAFGKLRGKQVSAMWQMLLTRSHDLAVTFSAIEAVDSRGSARWIAQYTFSATKRKVTNEISAQFTFKDGLIFTHQDRFDLNKWFLMAFGMKGYLFIVVPFLRRKFKERVRGTLDTFMEKLDK
jgi:ketosteroid isomerase-like protein